MSANSLLSRATLLQMKASLTWQLQRIEEALLEDGSKSVAVSTAATRKGKNSSAAKKAVERRNRKFFKL